MGQELHRVRKEKFDGARTVVGHGQNGYLGDGSVPAFDTSRTFVNGRQVGVHVTGISATTWYFFSGCRDLNERLHELLLRYSVEAYLSQRVGVRTHIRKNDQNVLF
jgi:hypothetical protein